MCDPEHYLPHREITPARRCSEQGCRVLLSSANGTAKCWQHGGWIELTSWWTQAEAFSQLMEQT